MRAASRLPPWALVLGGATSTQFGAGLGATLFDDLGSSGACLLRLGFAAVILLALWRPDARQAGPADLRLVLAFGLVLGLMNLTFYAAIDRIPLGVAVTIEFAGPLAVAVIGSRARADVAFALLAAVGIVALAGGGGSGGLDRLGLLFVSIAGACWAAYILLAKRVGQAFPGAHGLALASGIAALVPLGPGLVEGGTALLGPAALATGLAVALGSSVIPYSLEMSALRRMDANVFGVLMSLEPALAALAGLVVLGQGLRGRELVGMACVVAASIGVTRRADPAPVP